MINEASHSSQHPSVELPFDRLFTVRTDLDIETLLANASQDLASINVITFLIFTRFRSFRLY